MFWNGAVLNAIREISYSYASNCRQKFVAFFEPTLSDIPRLINQSGTLEAQEAMTIASNHTKKPRLEKKLTTILESFNFG